MVDVSPYAALEAFLDAADGGGTDSDVGQCGASEGEAREWRREREGGRAGEVLCPGCEVGGYE